MHSASSNAGTPAQPKFRPRNGAPAVFNWYQNKLEETLQRLYREDIPQRQVIVGIINEMNDSLLFGDLMARFEDAYDEAKKTGTEYEAVAALVARMYVAGTLRGERLVDL